MNNRLAFFVPSFRGGGAERVMLRLATGCARHDLTVDLVVCQAEGPYQRLVAPPVRVVDLRAHRVSASLPALVRYLRWARPAAMLTTLEHANVVALIARRLVGLPDRVVIREANTMPRLQVGPRWPRTWATRNLMRRCYPWADAAIAISQGVAEDLVGKMGLPSERVYVIYNPVALDDIRRKAIEPVHHPWFAPHSRIPVVLGVGRLTRQKDFGTLIRAFSQVRRHCQCRLVILGEGDLRRQLQALVRELGLDDEVDLPGFVHNPYAYMARAAVFALSSAWEGLGNVLIEAMACGCPIVSTDCRSGPAEVLEKGRYGRLVPVASPDALARAILDTLHEPLPADMLREGVVRFSEAPVVRQYLQVLRLPALPESDGVATAG